MHLKISREAPRSCFCLNRNMIFNRWSPGPLPFLFLHCCSPFPWLASFSPGFPLPSFLIHLRPSVGEGARAGDHVSTSHGLPSGLGLAGRLEQRGRPTVTVAEGMSERGPRVGGPSSPPAGKTE